MKRLLLLPFLISPVYAHEGTPLEAADPLAKVPDGIYKCTHENASVRCDPYTPEATCQPVNASPVADDPATYCHDRYKRKQFNWLTPEGKQRLEAVCTQAETKRR